MKTCPHCNREFSTDKSECPWCREEYWLPRETGDEDEAEPEQPAIGGCLQILLVPFLTSLALTLFLITAGIIIGLFIKIESNQIKLTWIVFSLLFGIAVFFILHFWKEKKPKQGKMKKIRK
ncbi:MAG: hypothetical protein GTO17_08130 [Candidatus Aminicenantes bacterium]|nr:hypothetical protein [Candidatus Aminicenantes bacterium]